MGIKILGTGSYLPPKIVTNGDIAASLDTSDEWIFSHTGIHARHVAGEGETTSSMAAEAARAAFEVIRRELAKNGAPSVLRGPIVIATVKGDIHDIGKNIVRALLENYGFKVVDLGRDVAPEAVVEAAVRLDCRLVGLSALMTTTVGFMEETIRLLKAAKPDCRTVVGGAVLTAEYAAQIGATYYGKDAMATVRVAEEVFG